MVSLRDFFQGKMLILYTDTNTAPVSFRLNTDNDTSVFKQHTEYWIIVLLFCTVQCSAYNGKVLRSCVLNEERRQDFFFLNAALCAIAART